MANAIVPTPNGKRVLVVGDGNFSFSLAYMKKLMKTSRGVLMITTSFDTEREVVRKYPEAVQVIEKLKSIGAHVVFGVDACQLERDRQKFGHYRDTQFNSIHFNFPHCGAEDIRRHRMLVSHFFYSAKMLLDQNIDSEIQIAVTQIQAEKWQIESRANDCGLFVKQNIDFDPANFPGYELKRHQNGKSFQRILWHGKKVLQQNQLFVLADYKHKALYPGLGKSIVAPRTIEVPALFNCKTCEKNFHTAQGLKTHTNMVHQNRQDEEIKHCEECDRNFNGLEAWRQHKIAKHSLNSAAFSSGLTKQPTEKLSIKCSICSFFVHDISDHAIDSQPLVIAKMWCKKCNKVFCSKRACNQHQLFCNSVQIM